MEDIKSPEAIKPIPKKAGAFKKFIRWFIFIVVLIFLLFGYWKYYYTYSDGLQGGKMQKISKRGNIFKTWEGYLLISPSTDPTTGTFSNKEWPFSVVNDSIAHVLENYAEKKIFIFNT